MTGPKPFFATKYVSYTLKECQNIAKGNKMAMKMAMASHKWRLALACKKRYIAFKPTLDIKETDDKDTRIMAEAVRDAVDA